MKTGFLFVIFLISVLALSPSRIFAQQDKSSTTISKTTAAKISAGALYKFTANYMYPLRGRSRNLTSDYILLFSKDTLNGQLPYFGTATAVNYGSADGGVNIETNNFTFTESVNKKGVYVIKYKIKGSNDITGITFTIYKDGTGDVSVRFFQRDGISYRGTIKKTEMP